ncbi:hypothetical protein O4H49_11665 [Kiloniella laminariae]|uniref:Uncharacterized protein n=1 Tax=Kiloniella laminariae TaxID=454162 RepID=A0ABT4LK08_9PROT|nr:hypothetical protein [Kiloniella laminariae]MCZ4281439.1 hypothetical protein [Kiloniella laminariae]
MAMLKSGKKLPETEKLPQVGEVYSKRTRFLQDWLVTDVYRSHVDGVIYARLSNSLMGEKNVGAAELLRRGSDWSQKVASSGTKEQQAIPPIHSDLLMVQGK